MIFFENKLAYFVVDAMDGSKLCIILDNSVWESVKGLWERHTKRERERRFVSICENVCVCVSVCE